MGKTPLPLVIWAWQKWDGHPTLLGLHAQGHTLEMMDFDGTPPYYTMYNEPDLILHPSAHRWTDAFWDEPAYLAAALKRARMAKRAAK